jgi:hypothetical protein
MTRRSVLFAAVAVTVLFGAVPTAGATPPPIQLYLSQGVAFGYLGHSCGGIQEQTFATGFDPTTGFPVGNVMMSTSCGGSGRDGGGHVTTYTASVTAMWDFTGVLVTSSVPATGTNDPNFTAFDANGNELYNSSTRAYLQWSATFIPVPRVLSISTAYGPATGGTSVTMTGTGFTNATAVSFGATSAATFTINNDNSITATAPAGNAGTVDVTVTSAGGPSTTSAADQFTFVAAPTITNLDPNSGPLVGGGYTTITGTNFIDVTGVSFGDQPTSYLVNSPTSISAYIPGGETADNVNVSVTTVAGTTPSTAESQYTYVNIVVPPPPAVTSLSPNTGSPSGGTVVTITGTGFTGATDISFGGTPATTVTVNSDTKITTIAPAGLGTVDVTVSGPNGTSAITLADEYTYFSPIVTGISPASGPAGGGTKVIITGQYFEGATDISFGGVSATSFTVNAAGTRITAIVPPEAGTGTTPVDVTVMTNGGPGTLYGAFTYLAPTVSRVIGSFGPAAGGKTVRIRGRHLYGAIEVLFGANTATIVKMSDRSLTVITPPGTGTVQVTVVTAAGTSLPGTHTTYTYR